MGTDLNAPSLNPHTQCVQGEGRSLLLQRGRLGHAEVWPGTGGHGHRPRPRGHAPGCSSCPVCGPRPGTEGAQGPEAALGLVWAGAGAAHSVSPLQPSILKQFLFLLLSDSAWSFVRARKQAKGPSTEERMNEVWSMHTSDYNSAVKRMQARTRATTWTNVETLRQVKESRHTETDNVPVHSIKCPEQGDP